MANRQHNQRITADILPLAMDTFEGDEEMEEPKHIFQVPKRNLMGEFGRPSLLEPPVSEHMKVYLRIRPFTEDEVNKGENQHCLKTETSQVVTTHAPKDSHSYKNTARNSCRSTTKYTFSHIFDHDTTQKDFFNQTMLGFVKDFIDGQNCLVFSYGVTNSGKTYTIQGNAADGGVLPRALDVLFNSISGRQWEGMDLKPDLFMNVTRLSADKEMMETKIKERVMKLSCDDDLDVMSLLGDDASDISTATNTTTCSESSNMSTMSTMSAMDNKDSLDNGDKILEEINNRVREEAKVSVDEQGQIKFSVWVSFAEIYNEQIHDLLEPISKKKNAKRPCLKLSEDQKGSPYIKGLKYIQVNSADEAYKLMTIGQRNLKTACTRLNHNSSRSHCIFNIKILRVVDKDQPHVARVSMLSLCDLAGSERYGKTQASGDRLKEAGNINTSLLTLGRCIETLRHNQAHKDHTRIVPFRESKLTRLFQNFFVGRGKAIMFVNVNQCASMFDETQHVFKFSAIASQVVVQQKPIFIKPKLPVPPSANPIPRSSISWATPARKKMAEQKEVENIPLPEDSDEDLEEEEEQVYTQANIDELLGVIELLQKDLESEITNKDKLETAIRKEVCEEMMKQFAQIEEESSERIRVREQMVEDHAEKRIQILLDKGCLGGGSGGVKKPRVGAADMMVDDDDEWVSSVLLHAEKVKVEDRDKTIVSLKEEVDKLNTKLSEAVTGRDKLEAEVEELNTKLSEAVTGRDKLEAEVEELNTKLSEAMTGRDKLEAENKVLQKQLADSRTQVDNKHVTEMEELKQKLEEYEAKIQTLEKDLAKSAATASNDDAGRADLVENLTQQLQLSRQQIKDQEREMGELNDMLTEAGETFQQKHDEIVKLQQLNTEYEKKLETQSEALSVLERAASDSKVAIETADQSLTKREECVTGLQAQIRDLEGEVTKYRNKARYFEKQLVEGEEETAHLRQRLETLTSEHAKSQEALIHGFTAEIANYKTQLFQLKAQLCGVKSPTKSPGGSLKSPATGTMKSPKGVLRSPGGSLRSPLARLELFPMSISPEKIVALEAAVSSPAKHGTSSPVKHGQEEKEKTDDTGSVKTLQKDHDDSYARIAELQHALSVSKLSVEDLEKKLESETKKYTEARNKVEELESRLKALETKHDVSEETSDNKLQEKQTELKQAQDKIKELEPLMKDYFSKSKQLTDSENKVKSLQGVVDEKQDCIKELESETKKLKESVTEKEKSVVEKEKAIDLLEERKEELEVLNKELKEMVNRTTTDLEAKDVEIKALSPKVPKLDKPGRAKTLIQTENIDYNSPIVIEKEKQISTLSTKVSKLKAGLRAKDLFCSETKEKVQELEFRIDEKEVESEDLKQNLEKSSHKIDDLQTALENKMKDLATTGEELAVVSVTMERLKRSVAEIRADNDSLQARLKEKEEEAAAKDHPKSEAQAEIDQLKEQLRFTKEDLADLNRKVQNEEAELDAKKLEVAKLELLLKEKEKVVEELNQKLAKAEADRGLLEAQYKGDKDSQNNIEKLKLLITEKDEEIEMFSQNLNSVLEERELEEVATANMTKQLKEIQSTLSDKETALSKLEAELEGEKKCNNSLNVEKEKLERKITEQEELIFDLESKISSLNANARQKDVLETSVHDLESAVADRMIELGDKDQLLEDKDKEISDLRAQLESIKETEAESAEVQVSNTVDETQHNKVLQENESLQNLNTELQKSVEELKKEIVWKLSEIESLEGDVKTMKEQLKLAWEANASAEKIEKVTRTFSDSQVECNMSEDGNERLSNALVEIAQLKASEHAQRALHHKVKGELQEALLEVENNRCELNTLREHGQKVEHLEKIVEEKNAELVKAENALGELSGKDHVTKQTKDELNSAIEMKTTEINNLQQLLEKTEKELTKSKEKVSLHDRINADLREEYENRLANKQGQIDAMKHECSSIDSQIQSINAENAEVTATVMKLKEKVEAREIEMENKQTVIMALQKQLQESLDRNNDLEDELEEKRDEMIKLQNAAETEKKAESVNDNRLDEALAELAKLRSSEHTLKASHSKVKGELQEALLEVENCRSEMESLKGKTAKHGDLEKLLKDKTAKLEETELTITELKCKIEGMDTRTERTEQLEGMCNDIEKEKSEATELVTDLKCKIAEAENEKTKAEETISELTSKITELEKEKSDKEKSETKKVEVPVPTNDPLLTRKLNTVVSKLNETEIRNRSLIKEVTQLQGTVERLEGDLEEAQQAGDGLTEREVHRRARSSILPPADTRQSISSPSTKVELVKSKERAANLQEQLKKASATMQEWLGKFSEAENKLQQKNQELMHARQTLEHLQAQQSELARSSDKELQDYMDQNNELKVQILKKEGDLEAQTRTVADLQRKLSTEHGDIKGLEKEKREKEEMIALMKETLDEQDAIMQQQDDLISSKEAEIQSCDAEYKELQQKYQTLLENKNTSKSQDFNEQREVAKITAERDLARERLSTAETQLRDVEKKLAALQTSETDLEGLLCKAVEEKDKLRRIVKENNQELKELEKSLTESRRECEELKSDGADKCSETRLAEARRDWDKTAHDLNAKIKTLQCNNKELRFNVSNLEKKLEASDQERRTLNTKLQEFRDERDKLVSGLEAVLKKKDAELKQHKDLIKQLKEKEIHITKSWHDERQRIAEGLQGLNDTNVTVKTETPDDTYGRTSPTKQDSRDHPPQPDTPAAQDNHAPVRSNSRNRPPRPDPPKTSSETPRNSASLRNSEVLRNSEAPCEEDTTEIQTWTKSPGMVRRRGNSSAEKEVKTTKRGGGSRRGRKRNSPTGPDESLPPLPKRRSKDSVADASMLSEAPSEDYSSHLQIDATPPVAAKTLRRTRKKNGSQLDLSKNEEEKPATSTRPSRQAKRSAKHRLLESFRESPMAKTSKRILDNIAEAFSPRSPSKSPSKSPRREAPGPGSSLKRNKSESKENIPATALEPQEKKKGAGRGRRHKLYSDDYISEPFESTGDFVQSPEDHHQTVTRSLRSRRQ